MTDTDGLDSLDDQVAALETSLGAAAGMAAGFDAELRRIHETFAATGQGAERFERSLSRGLSRAIDGAVFDGMKLSDALREVGETLVNTAYRAAVKPVTDHVAGLITGGIGGLFGELSPFAKGGAFTQGRVMPFANGGVVGQATAFPLRRGMGLMGEAGPEAILPLARGADGSLGVRAQGGGAPVTVVMNVSTPDAESFRRSQSQIAAAMGRAIGRGGRNR